MLRLTTEQEWAFAVRIAAAMQRQVKDRQSQEISRQRRRFRLLIFGRSGPGYVVGNLALGGSWLALVFAVIAGLEGGKVIAPCFAYTTVLAYALTGQFR